MTFATKAARSHARKVLTEGDLVFTVGTKGEPTASQDQGRVLGVFRVSDLEVNTQDYGLPGRHENPEFDSVTRFPYALHPIAVWEVTSPGNMFAELVGPLTPIHHLQAQSKVVELDEITAEPLLALDRHEVPTALPKTEFGKGLVAQKNSKLAPKHRGSFTGTFGDHDIWYVYTLVLRNERKKVLAVKVGYSSDPGARVPSFLIRDWLHVEVIHHALEYQTRIIHDGIVPPTPPRLVYAAIVAGALVLSSNRWIRVFAGLIAVSVAITHVFFAYAFISTWCFFAAILSVYLIAVIWLDARQSTPAPA